MGGGIAGSALRCDTVETAALAEGEPTNPRPQGANIPEGSKTGRGAGALRREGCWQARQRWDFGLCCDVRIAEAEQPA